MVLAQLIAKVFPQWLKPICPSPNSPAELGCWGEKVATQHLKRNGYSILYRNFRAKHGGEVDIVARHRASATLCFIEVKTRSSEQYGRPAHAVNKKKQQLIIRGALAWLRLLEMPEIAFRFDIVEVISNNPPQITIIENAFQLPENIFY